MFWKSGSTDDGPPGSAEAGSRGHSRDGIVRSSEYPSVKRSQSSDEHRMRGSVISPSRGYNASGGTRPSTPYITPAYDKELSGDSGKRKMGGDYSDRYTSGRQTADNGTRSSKAYLRTPKSGMVSRLQHWHGNDLLASFVYFFLMMYCVEFRAFGTRCNFSFCENSKSLYSLYSDPRKSS